jgi:hypothetical protein
VSGAQVIGERALVLSLEREVERLSDAVEDVGCDCDCDIAVEDLQTDTNQLRLDLIALRDIVDGQAERLTKLAGIVKDMLA